MADTGGEINPPKKLVVDTREEKLKLVRERQAEERQRRLEELKKHALEAQQLREQKEVERRKRMEDLRLKDTERRSQVEERKKLIWEAERERRESIVRKNQERDARMDAKRRNERSSIVFAFGSSTPRLMDTYDSGCFMVPRRATSTANLRVLANNTSNASMSASMVAPSIPRRSSEREMEPKKRASSAGGLYRYPGDQMSTSIYEVFHWEGRSARPRLSLAPPTSELLNIDLPSCAHLPPVPVADTDDAQALLSGSTLRVGRRKTDLMPTTPSPRDGAYSRPGSGTRSLARTPGDVTPSRPGSVLSQYSLSSASAARLRATPRRARPFSIHVTGISKDKDKLSSPSEEKAKPLISETKGKEIKENKVKVKESKVKEIKTIDSKVKENKVVESKKEVRNNKPAPAPKPPVSKKQIQQKNEEIKRAQPKTESEVVVVENNNVPASPDNNVKEVPSSEVTQAKEQSLPEPVKDQPVVDDLVQLDEQPAAPQAREESITTEASVDVDVDATEGDDKGNVMSKSKIITEEEAKAALAERRRLAREQAEREAEAERLRLELEAQAEEERIRREEEEQRLMEEEQLRLLEQSRKMEEERLMQAIQETQRREEEEKERKQQEEVARLEKEEAEKKAREEAEKQRIEMAERLKKEEEERTARRKRVEAIMKRTRNNGANASNKAECEKGEEDGAEHEKDEAKGTIEAFLHGERVCTDKTLTNGQQTDNHKLSEHGNNQSNGVAPLTLEHQDCINTNSNPPTIETPLIAFQGKTKDTPMAANYLA